MNKIVKFFTRPDLNIVFLLALGSLIFTKPFDIGFNFLGLPRNGEFLGFVLRLSDLSLVYSIWWVILNIFKIDFTKVIKRLTIKSSFVYGFCLLVLFSYWLITGYETWYIFKIGFLYLASLSLGGLMIYRYKPMWLLVLVPYFLFDHILISSSLVLQMWLILGIVSTPDISRSLSSKTHKIIKFKLLTIYILNFAIALFQVFSGHSFGLFWLGESNINVDTVGGIAKQILPFLDQIILRGYGILPHPNILGFLGVFLILFLDSGVLRHNYKISKLRTLLIYGAVSSLILVSFSRMGILSLLILILCKAWINLGVKKYFKIALNLLCLVLFSFVFISGLLTRNTSDSYRFEQHSYLLKILEREPLAIVFGVGPGQYSNRLKTNNITRYQWQNEPFYQPFGNFLTEVGIIGIVLLILTLNKLNRRLQSISCKKL